MAARYETFAALARIKETGNLETFATLPPKKLAKWLRQQFNERTDKFILEDRILSSLNPRRIQFVALAYCLVDQGRSLDKWCAVTKKRA